MQKLEATVSSWSARPRWHPIMLAHQCHDHRRRAVGDPRFVIFPRFNMRSTSWLDVSAVFRLHPVCPEPTRPKIALGAQRMSGTSSQPIILHGTPRLDPLPFSDVESLYHSVVLQLACPRKYTTKTGDWGVNGGGFRIRI